MSRWLIPYNAEVDGTAKTVLAGCYKFGHATLLRQGGSTMTSVVEIKRAVCPVNTDEEGLCRTIKAQYYKNGMANFARVDGFGATAIAVYEDESGQGD